MGRKLVYISLFKSLLFLTSNYSHAVVTTIGGVGTADIPATWSTSVSGDALTAHNFNGSVQIYLRSSENAQAIGLLLNICDNIRNRILDADTAARAIEIDKGLTTDAFRVLDSLAIHENTKTLERILNVIRNKGSITTSKLQNSHNFKAAEIEEFKKAIEEKEVAGVRVEEETASNNKTQTTFVAI